MVRDVARIRCFHSKYKTVYLRIPKGVASAWSIRRGDVVIVDFDERIGTLTVTKLGE